MPLSTSTFNQFCIERHSFQIDVWIRKVLSFVCVTYIAWHAVLWNARFDQSRQKIVQRQKFCDLLTYQDGLSNTRLYCMLAITCVIRYDVWVIHDSMPLKESTFSQLSILCHSLQIDILVCKVVSSVCISYIVRYEMVLTAWFDQSSEKIAKWENDRGPHDPPFRQRWKNSVTSRNDKQTLNGYMLF